MLRQIFIFSIFCGMFLLFSTCNNTKQLTIEVTNPLVLALDSKKAAIKKVMDSSAPFNLQIKYSKIKREGDSIIFTDYDFQVDSTNYFYPASTVKFPVALLALSKLNSLPNFDRFTPFYIEGDTVVTTIKREIEKIFAVSDNMAFNRLFEFLGQDYINKELNNILQGPIRISHRLSTDEADEITTKPIIIYLNDSTTTQLPAIINTSAKPLHRLKATKKGKGYYEEDSLIYDGFDFSKKNYYPIETQHEFLKKVIFANQYKPNEKLNLSKKQLAFVHKAMHTLPRNIGYDASMYYDGYCKFFLFGDTKENIPENIKIYNKVGDAYGTLTDCAYVVDSKNKIEFLLNATILVNKNDLFNDNNYEYEEIGIPFLAELGREIYAIELTGKRKDN